MEKLDTNKLRGEYQDAKVNSDGQIQIVGMGDDTNNSFQAIGEKINEIVDWINHQEEDAR